MVLPGSPSFFPIQTADLVNLSLQTQERISAEVLQVAGERVYLSINGVQVIARLTSSDQAARLMEKRKANFIVREQNQKELVLQLVSQNPEEEQSPPEPTNIIPELLARAGLAADEENTLLAQELLKYGFPIHRDTLEPIRQFLIENQLDAFRFASAVIALLHQGAAVSEGSLELILAQTPQLAEVLGKLLSMVKNQAEGKKPSLHFYLNQAAARLQELLIGLEGGPDQIESNLRLVLPLLAKSLESQLKDLLQENKIFATGDLIKPGLLSLTYLLGMADLEEGGSSSRSEELTQLLDRLRLTQLGNSAGNQKGGPPVDLLLELPVAIPHNDQYLVLKNAYLRVYLPPGQDPEQPESNKAHIKLSMEIDPGETISIDMLVLGRNIQGNITTSTGKIRDIAVNELPSLAENLGNKGYNMQSINCKLDPDQGAPFHPLSAPSAQKAPGKSPPRNKVNLEI